MFLIWATALGLVITGCKNSTGTPGLENDAPVVKRQAAEYETQEAIWLLWPPANHTLDRSNDSVTLDLIRTIAPHQPLMISAANDSIKGHALKILKDSDLDLPTIKVFTLPSEEIWIRDMGPNFVQLENNETAIADFQFDAWGYGPSGDPYVRKMEAYDRGVAKKLGLPVIQSNIISEGGNREINSQGVLMLTETVTLGRNPGISKQVLEQEFQQVLGVKKVIWLKQGLVEDQHSFLGPIHSADGLPTYTVVTTNGHVDEYARFVNDSTILLADVPEEDLKDPIGEENKERMEENLEILKNSGDINGKPFSIKRIPLPKPLVFTMYPGDPVYDYLSSLDYLDGSVFPKGDPIKVIAAASYLNFIITNDLIIVQKYGNNDPQNPNYERDQQAQSILRELFPHRKVVAINSLSVNLGGGGIHCISMNQPLYETP